MVGENTNNQPGSEVLPLPERASIHAESVPFRVQPSPVRSPSASDEQNVSIARHASANATSKARRIASVTHEMGLASHVGSRIVFMDVVGRILEDCTRDEFLATDGPAAANKGFSEQDHSALAAENSHG